MTDALRVFRPRSAPSLLAGFGLAFLLTNSAFGQSTNSPSSGPANIQEQILYQSAYEIAIWATPVLDVLQMRSELVKHGATEGTLAYFGSPPNRKLEVPT
jgi:hypothetical protein